MPFLLQSADIGVYASPADASTTHLRMDETGKVGSNIILYSEHIRILQGGMKVGKKYAPFKEALGVIALMECLMPDFESCYISGKECGLFLY